MMRPNSFARRTSFEENILNQHLNQMKKVLLDTGLQIKPLPIPPNDASFTAERENGMIAVIEKNSYLV